MPNFHKAKSYITYWLNAVNEHSLQGPFIYDLYQKVLKRTKHRERFQAIDKVRDRLENSRHTVNVQDLGAGSTVANTTKRRIADIAKHGVVSKKYGSILYDLVHYTEAHTILELGTSLGMSTLYLSAHPTAEVTTIEGAENLLNIAESIFEAEGRTNVTCITGDIDDILPELLIKKPSFDLIFFDANHTEEATLSYFHQCLQKAQDTSCFVFDDIHWSKGMERAWNQIKMNYRVTLSIDIFQMGILFFNPELRKQHYILEV